MKIVIDIDKDYYEIIKRYVKVNRDVFKPYTIIANGTPLPKGHGRLIDVDDIDNHIVGSVDTRGCPTIIEADKGETE